MVWILAFFTTLPLEPSTLYVLWIFILYRLVTTNLSFPIPLHFRLNSTCNDISKPSRSNLRDPKLYNFLGEHPEIPPKSSVLHMIEFFPSLIINPVSNPAGILLQINKNQICNMQWCKVTLSFCIIMIIILYYHNVSFASLWVILSSYYYFIHTSSIDLYIFTHSSAWYLGS